MHELQKSLVMVDEAYLIGMSNKGIYKRACKDLEHAEVSVQYHDNYAEVVINGETCDIREPLWESSCSCPSRTVCRHLISAMLWLREHFQDTNITDESKSEPEPELDGLPDMLRQELQQISPAQLKKALGSQAKIMLPWVQEQKIILEETSILSGVLPDENHTAVRLLYPLEHATCACHKKDLCVHKAIVILAWQVKENLIKAEDFQEQVQNLSQKDTKAVQDSAEQSCCLLYDLLKWGLVRMPEHMPEHLEASAVQSHALRMANAERMLRDIGGKLTECRDRRAVFQPEMFLQKFCTCAMHLQNLQKECISEADLGEFKGTYQEYTEDLEILPIGQREIKNSEYAGTIYYFLNLNQHAEQKFLTYADIRPVFYGGNTRHKSITPWNANVPMKVLMDDKMVLKHAKILDGKLSGSKETLIVSRTKANLNCAEIRNLLYSDFRKLAVDYSQKVINSETDRLCLVQLSACLYSKFDTHAQCYQMQIADNSGNVIMIQVRYQAEYKHLIQLLERIGSNMLEHPEKETVWLCSAYFKNGRLQLYPIEVYDFISLPSQVPEYVLPLDYESHNSAHVNQIFMLLQNVQIYFCEVLQSGLQSANTGNLKKLYAQAESFGMQGFSDLLQQFMQVLEQSRHALQENRKEIIALFCMIQKYIRIGIEKLEVLCALDAMKL